MKVGDRVALSVSFLRMAGYDDISLRGVLIEINKPNIYNSSPIIEVMWDGWFDRAYYYEHNLVLADQVHLDPSL